MSGGGVIRGFDVESTCFEQYSATITNSNSGSEADGYVMVRAVYVILWV